MKKQVNLYLSNPKFPETVEAYYVHQGKIAVDTWVEVPGEHFIDFEPITKEQAAMLGVKMLNELLRKERIEFEKRVVEIQTEINKFLAIEHGD